jgi:hypothetical protein
MRSNRLLGLWLLLVLGVLLSATLASAEGRYVWKETAVWQPGDLVLDLTVAVGFLPTQIVVTTDSGDDFWMDIVTRGEAASDTVAGASDTEVRYIGTGEAIPALAVFLVRDASAAADTVLVRCYDWLR